MLFKLVEGDIREKYIKLLILLVVILTLLHMCFSEKHYSFRQDISAVVNVEVYENKWYSDNPEKHVYLTTLEAPEYRELLTGIMAIPCNIPYDPPTGFGKLVLRIHYADGSVEIIGESNSIYIPAEGKKQYFYYNFQDAFNQLVSQYIDSVLEIQ